MHTSSLVIDKARQLSAAGHHAEVVEYLGSRAGGELEQSPSLALLYGTAQARLGHHDEGKRWLDLALDQARERFQRAIEIDTDELDAHYQLGRIARAQNRLAEAISNFEQVVQRDQFHAQNEIWREIGATYIAAGQYSDARDVLEKFLDRRPNDPEGLYLMGRAHAGLGDNQEAASSMQACIEAVKTAPAYKYRTEKRWLNEAQQFLKGRKKQEAIGRQ